MPALGMALGVFVGVGIALAGLRSSGGWMCLYRLWRGQREECRGYSWAALTTFERGWFFLVPCFSAAGVVLTIIGTVVVMAN